EGMIVRTPDGEKLGRVASVGAEDFTIERGLVFRHRFVAPLEHVILVDDEKDELVCRPVELPFRDREKMEMMFGSPETPDELEHRREDAELADQLLEDPHLHHE
ncbi:MAG TPA: hypothetical protein VHB97_20575, partial [Polyangia bacterium]|nr:hypothetical protein [Polyangia bacterium]